MISGDSLGLDREKIKKMNFTCRACVEGERWEKEAIEGGRKRQWRGQIGEKEQELGEWRREIGTRMGEWEKSARVGREEKKGAKEGERQEADRAESPGKGGE